MTFRFDRRSALKAGAALAGAHDVLTRENWEAASLHQIIEKTGLGCGAAPGREPCRGRGRSTSC